MKLAPGRLALDFTATDVHGNDFKLSPLKGQKIVLSFYRNVECPFCNRRIHQIMGHNLRFKQSGVQLVMLFESSNAKLSQSIFHQGISPWPLIGDPTLDIYKKYGVEPSVLKTLNTFLHSSFGQALKDTKELQLPKDNEATKTLIPADFLIDEQFVIHKAHYGQHLDDHIPLEELKSFAGIS